MPYIDCKFSKKMTEQQKESLKAELGKAIALIGKPESYLMVGITDNYTLYFGGRRVDDGAYVSVSLLGKATPQAYNKFTAEICRVLTGYGVDSAATYVTYHEIDNWGFNGSNF